MDHLEPNGIYFMFKVGLLYEILSTFNTFWNWNMDG